MSKERFLNLLKCLLQGESDPSGAVQIWYIGINFANKRKRHISGGDFSPPLFVSMLQHVHSLLRLPDGRIIHLEYFFVPSAI